MERVQQQNPALSLSHQVTRHYKAFHGDDAQPTGLFPEYVFRIIPKRKAKGLLLGHIWVDEKTFQIRRMEGVPVKSPSFWSRTYTDSANRGSERDVNIRFPRCNSNGTADGALHRYGCRPRSARADISYTEALKHLPHIRSLSAHFNPLVGLQQASL
jgi:hypothetical protein